LQRGPIELAIPLTQKFYRRVITIDTDGAAFACGLSPDFTGRKRNPCDAALG
jgi:hypothetical protein